MTARFYVTRTFTIRSRNLFVLSGRIISGEIKPGMEAHIPCNTSFSITTSIHGVEYIDSPGRESEVGLTIRFEDEGERSILEGLNVGEEEIEVRSPSRNGA